MRFATDNRYAEDTAIYAVYQRYGGDSVDSLNGETGTEKQVWHISPVFRMTNGELSPRLELTARQPLYKRLWQRECNWNKGHVSLGHGGELMLRPNEWSPCMAISTM